MTWLVRALGFVAHAVLASLMHHLATALVLTLKGHWRLASFVLSA